MFHAADLLVMNKIDLLPYVQFDADAAIAYARRARPGLDAVRVSASTGAGFDAWLAWLLRGIEEAKRVHDADIAALRLRVAELARQSPSPQNQRPPA
jgi:hydrogenase nickel incorporation protein HypB